MTQLPREDLDVTILDKREKTPHPCHKNNQYTRTRWKSNVLGIEFDVLDFISKFKHNPIYRGALQTN